jgi:hypothetical protein
MARLLFEARERIAVCGNEPNTMPDACPAIQPPDGKAVRARVENRSRSNSSSPSRFPRRSLFRPTQAPPIPPRAVGVRLFGRSMVQVKVTWGWGVRQNTQVLKDYRVTADGMS